MRRFAGTVAPPSPKSRTMPAYTGSKSDWTALKRLARSARAATTAAADAAPTRTSPRAFCPSFVVSVLRSGSSHLPAESKKYLMVSASALRANPDSTSRAAERQATAESFTTCRQSGTKSARALFSSTGKGRRFTTSPRAPRALTRPASCSYDEAFVTSWLSCAVNFLSPSG